MAKTIWISIRCLNCHEWLDSQAHFDDFESFDTSVLFDYLAACPHCGMLTRSNQENFRAKFEDGVILGVEP